MSSLEDFTGKLVDAVESLIQKIDFCDMALKRKHSFIIVSPLLRFSLKQTNKQINKQTNKEINKQTNKQMKKQTNKQTNK
jgi:hypothetical protein